MAANEVKLTIRIAEDGKNLDIIAKKSKEAASGIEKVSNATEKANKTRNTYNKREKGVAQNTSNSTKAFAKQAQGISGGLVPAYATLAANVFALSAAFNFFKNAADLRILEQSQVAYANNTGIALQSITQRLREASQGLLGFREAGQAAAIGLAKGFSPKQLEDLAVGAQKASTALGRNFEDSFDRLIRGASKAEPELLDELGITLRLEDATRRYADALGIQADQLTTTQRSQAVLVETQRQLNELFGNIDAVANPFVKLSKTFEDLVRTTTSIVLPLFEGLANVINKSGSFALATFGLLALNIFKAAIPMDGIKQKFEDIEQASKDSLEGSKQALDDYKKKIQETTKELEKSRIASSKSQARDLMKAGENVSGSALIQRVGKGIELTPLQRGQLKKMLNDAEKQYLNHGEIVKNTFKGVNIELVRGFRTSLDKMNQPATGFFTRMGQRYKLLQLRAEKFNATVSRGLTKAFSGAAGAAAKFGQAADKALRFAGVIGILTMVYELVRTIARSPFSIAMGIAKALDASAGFFGKFVNFVAPLFLGFIDSIINGFSSVGTAIKATFFDGLRIVFDKVDGIINGTIDKINGIIEAFNELSPAKLPLIRLKSSLKDIVPSVDANKTSVSNLAGSWQNVSEQYTTYQDLLNNSSFGKSLFIFESAMDAADRSRDALKQYSGALEKTSEDLNQIVDGIRDAKTEAEAGEKIAQGILSIGASSYLSALRATTAVTSMDGTTTTREFVLNAKDRAKALEDLKKSFQGAGPLSEQFERIFAGIDPNDINSIREGEIALRNLEAVASAATGGMSTLDDQVANITSSLRSSLGSGDTAAAILSLEEMQANAYATADAFAKLGQNASATDALKKYNTALGEGVESTDQFLIKLREIQVAQQALIFSQEVVNTLTGEAKDILAARNKVLGVQNKLNLVNATLQTELTEIERRRLEQQKQLLELQLKLAEIEKRRAAGVKLAERSGLSVLGAAFSGDADRSAAAAGVEAAQKEVDRLQAAADRGEKVLDELAAAQTALATARADQINVNLYSTAAAFDALEEQFRKFGPEGELTASIAGAIGDITSASVSAFQIMGDSGESATNKILAGIGLVNTAIQSIGAISKASSDMRIKALDQEIEAEKRRDGKSKESIARITALEQKRESEKKKAFEMDKKMKIAQTITSTAVAAMEAYRSLAGIPIVGPALAAAAAGAIIALGAKQVSLISSTSYQSASGSGGAAQPTTVTMGQRSSSVDVATSQSASGELAYFRGAMGTGGPENFQPSNAFAGMKYRANGGNTGVMVGEQGPELFVPDRPGRIVPSDEVQQSSVSNINFSINAVDAAGVEEVLINQRGNIIGMLREAANAHGQEFLEAVDVSVYAAPDRRTV